MYYIMDAKIIDLLMKIGLITSIGVKADAYESVDDLISKGIVTIPGAKEHILDIIKDIEPSEETIEEVNPTETEPAVIEPAVIEPAVIEPTVIEPAVIEPTVIEPTEIKPAETELKNEDNAVVIEPVVIEPVEEVKEPVKKVKKSNKIAE
jgi:polyhydroxyalkanoate synthesis regulator phasin